MHCGLVLFLNPTQKGKEERGVREGCKDGWKAVQDALKTADDFARCQ